MSQQRIRALVAAHDSIDPLAVEQMIAEEPLLELAGLLDSVDDWARRDTYGNEALVIVCEHPAPEVVHLIGDEATARPLMPVIVVCGGSPNGFVREVFEAGADDIIVSETLVGIGPDVYFAIEKALTRKAAPMPDSRTAGDLIVVLGPKGGTGKTLTASNLGLALAADGERVAMIDLDLQFGDLGLVLGMRPERSIFDLVTAGGSLDAQKLRAFMQPHQSGAQVLLAPTRPDHAGAVRPDFLRDLFAVARREFDFVIVDTPPGFTPEVIATIDSSTSVCLIGTLDLPSLKNAKLGAETLELMGYPTERIRLVLNRADSSVGVSHSDVVSVLGRAPDVLIPSSREIVRSVNAGQPIVMSGPRSDGAKAYRALAKVYERERVERSGEARPATKTRRRRGLVRA